ncbi:MAG: DUF3274 domain-containing protein, partial [Burkholderiales bacterium]
NADGTLVENRSAKRFIAEPGNSPVIRFRWGFKASLEELERYRGKIWLNVANSWGGGPFANGCPSLPDLWGEGLHSHLFLWFYAQQINSMAGREIYDCPPRAYFVHAAQRLADLIGKIRTAQPMCPITVVSHSQGNMVTLASAFLGVERDPTHLADTYILANPPYSLIESFVSNLASKWQTSAQNEHGEQTRAARLHTLRNFVTRMRTRADGGQPIDKINREQECLAPGTKQPLWCLGKTPKTTYKTNESDRDNRGRVFLYANPHDQVISASPLQGIGWRGVNAAELAAIDPGGACFAQRIWAQGLPVGDPLKTQYHYTRDHWNAKAKGGTGDFWHPPSPKASYQITHDPNQGRVSKMFTVAGAPVAYAVLLAIGAASKATAINATPSADHAVPLNAPPVPEPIRPRTLRAGLDNAREFDEGLDINAHAAAETRPSVLYEYHARLRAMQERGEAPVEGAVSKAHYHRYVKELYASFDQEAGNATDHGTILTNPEHSRKVIAYDVAVGYVTFGVAMWQELRTLADWRYANDKNRMESYFARGVINYGQVPHKHPAYHPSKMPKEIVDERRNKPSMLANTPILSPEELK